jgi:signal transduction histidine kinase
MPLNSFLTRLIWWCVSPLALFAAYLAFHYVRHEHEEHDREAQRLAQTLADAVDHDLGSRVAALRILAASPLADGASLWPGLYQEAQRFQQSFGSHVVLAAPDRRLLFTTRLPLGTALPELPRPQGRSALQDAVQTLAPAVGDIFRDPIDGDAGDPLVGVAVPVVRDGKAVSVMGTTVALREFQKFIDQLDRHPNWSIRLLDGTGATIVRSTPPAAPAPTSESADSAERFSARSAAAPWSVQLDIPRSVYLAPLIQAAATFTIAIVSVTFVGVLGGTFAARRLGRDVRSLAQARAPGDAPPDIAEIAAVRRLLDESIERRDQAELALLASHAELQRLFAAQDRVQENERRRISLELHDDLQQTLAAISINVAALRERAGSGASADAGALPVLVDINGLAAAAMDSTRRIVAALRPQILEDLGLLPALEALASQFQSRNGIECAVQGHGDLDARLLAAPALTTSLYRVAQEALTNVAKHARAKQVEIHLAHAQTGRLRMSIADDGQGMAALDRQKPGAFGLAGIEERMRALGGELHVHSSPGAGTRVEVTVPLP